MDFTTIGDNNCVSYSNRAAITHHNNICSAIKRIVRGKRLVPVRRLF